MGLKKSIYLLKGKTPILGETKIASRDVKSLKEMLTTWLRAGGNGFIFRIDV